MTALEESLRGGLADAAGGAGDENFVFSGRLHGATVCVLTVGAKPEGVARRRMVRDSWPCGWRG